MDMAEDVITPETVPYVNTNNSSELDLTQLRSDDRMQKDLGPYVVSNTFQNPMYETGCIPSEINADGSVPVKDNTTSPESQHFRNTPERLTNSSKEDKGEHSYINAGCNEHDDGDHKPYTTQVVDTSQAIKTVSADVHPNPNNNICQNPCNNIYPGPIPTTTTEKDDQGENVNPQNDIEAAIDEHIDILDDETALEPYAVAYECTSDKSEHDADKVDSGHDINAKKQSAGPNSLNWNPMYVSNVLQKERCQCSYGWVCVAVIITALLVASIIFGIWLYYKNTSQDVQKTNFVEMLLDLEDKALSYSYLPDDNQKGLGVENLNDLLPGNG
uniref:Uncharacterized protein n=1 Tax=Branchiostoma floridae TaxID=7739 RepID=C3YVS8_BRAFL|eukprot:XP_002599600.1 hypothetical protein BRAFLDRAFT_77697 [Branchiostoma floridae]